MIDSLFQGGAGQGGTQNAILSSEEYLSQAQRHLNNIEVRPQSQAVHLPIFPISHSTSLLEHWRRRGFREMKTAAAAARSALRRLSCTM